VANLDRSLTWYSRVLGLSPFERTDRIATLGVPGGSPPLLELHELPGAKPMSRRGRLGLYHFAILLPERAALGRFLRHLSEIGERAGMSDHLVSEDIYLADPDGLGIEVYADRPRGTWRVNDGQLLMATDPLDVSDVLGAAGPERWSGMPNGTTMGHVHLFVGDLGQAEAFYHRGLGFDKVVWSYPGALFLSAGGYHHHLGTNTWAAGAPRAAQEDARMLEWELLVPGAKDVADALGSIEGAGTPVERDRDSGVARDPWGTAVRVRAG
jgi:catechol 2,3-dioxygenase